MMTKVLKQARSPLPARRRAPRTEETRPPSRARAARPRPKPEVDRLTDQMSEVAARLDAALLAGDLRTFYSALRASDLPLLPFYFDLEPTTLYRLSADLLHRLGSRSPAVALAVEQHFYMVGAIATMPLQLGAEALQLPRRTLLTALSRNRCLLANTNAQVHSERLGAYGTLARRDGDGFRVNGSSTFMSMATEGDMIVFLAPLAEEDQLVAFFADLKGNPTIEVGSFTFPNAMLDSDTRRVSFHDTPLRPENVLTTSLDSHFRALFAYTIVWHQGLLGALYLGAAAGAFAAVRRFCQDTALRDGRRLAEVDSVVADLGRLALRYQAAWSLVQRVERGLEALTRSASDLPTVLDLASAAKYTATSCAEEVVATARRILGARAFTGGNAIERLSQEVVFGTLSLELTPTIERKFGLRVLEDRLAEFASL